MIAPSQRKINILTCFLLLLTFLLGRMELTAQNSASLITGNVTDDKNQIIPLVNISLKGTTYGTVTDEQGHFLLSIDKPGKYQLAISCLGYKTQWVPIDIKLGQTISLNKELTATSTNIDEIVIAGKSEATLLREKSYAIEVIELKKFKNLSTSGNDLLAKISGVNIRQSGGFGSDFSLSLNGLSDGQIRMFIDGIPMDYFGSSLSLNNFSANLIERIEVYKGVVPVHLSSDALGGAINVVTQKTTDSFLDASYSAGSYGTHIASLNAQHRNKNGLTFKLKSFYNRAENNYKVPIYLVDFETGKESDEETWVERFHDAYSSKMVWAEAGFTQKKWADQFMLGIMYSDNYKEVQQPTHAVGQAKIPYGEVSTAEEKWIANLQYTNNHLLNDHLGIKAYMVGVFSQDLFSDTSSYRYDWFGNKEFFHEDVGEIENRKTLLHLDKTNYLGNINAEYLISTNHTVAANFSLNYLTLQGSDDFKQQNDTQFKNPSDVTKNVVGLAYSNSLLSELLKSSLFLKMYDYNLNSVETNYQGDIETPLSINKEFVGYGLSSTFHRSKFQFKASYEYATRFPEIFELFGDGLNNEANPELQPEQSHNYNLGVIYSYGQNTSRGNVSVNLFARDASNFIRQEVTGIKAKHINDASVISKGIDLTASYHLQKIIQLKLNGTFVDLRNNTSSSKGGSYKARVPNVPYLYGNIQATYHVPQLISDHEKLSITASQFYVHSFPYAWEHLASNDKVEVPNQFSTNLDLVYSLSEGRYNFSAGVVNLFDAAIYDNFEQRRPGRTFNFKFRYFIQ